MSEGKIFTCPTCGGSLSLDNAGSQVECPYCGNMVVVPKELRAPEAQAAPDSTPITIAVNDVATYIPMGDPLPMAQVNRWLKWGIWAFVAFIILTVIIPVVCSVIGILLGVGGAFLPFFIK